MIKRSIEALYLAPLKLQDSSFFLRMDSSWSHEQNIAMAYKLSTLHPAHFDQYCTKLTTSIDQILLLPDLQKQQAYMYISAIFGSFQSHQFILDNKFTLKELPRLFSPIDLYWKYYAASLSKIFASKMTLSPHIADTIAKPFKDIHRVIKATNIELQKCTSHQVRAVDSTKFMSYLHMVCLSLKRLNLSNMDEYAPLFQSVIEVIRDNGTHIDHNSLSAILSLFPLMYKPQHYEDVLQQFLTRISHNNTSIMDGSHLINYLNICYQSSVPYREIYAQKLLPKFETADLFLLPFEQQIILFQCIYNMKFQSPEWEATFTKLFIAVIEVLELKEDNLNLVKLLLENVITHDVSKSYTQLYAEIHKYACYHLDEKNEKEEFPLTHNMIFELNIIKKYTEVKS